MTNSADTDLSFETGVESADAQSNRVAGWATGIVIGALLASVLLDDANYERAFAGRLVQMILDALIIAGVGALLSQTRAFRDLLERRLALLVRDQLTGLAATVERSFVTRATNPMALRALSLPTLRSIERAARAASLPVDPPPEVIDLLNAIDTQRDNLELWREEFVIDLRYEPVDKVPGPYRLHSDAQCSFVNLGNSPKTIPQQIIHANRVAGTPLASERPAYVLERLEFDGVDQLAASNHSVRQEDVRTLYTRTVELTIPPTGNRPGPVLRRVSDSLNGVAEPHVMIFLQLVHRLEVSVRHPEDVYPSLYVFGIGSSTTKLSPMKPLTEQSDYRRCRPAVRSP